MAQTLDQKRANHAWTVVQQLKPTEEAEQFALQAKKLPARIMACSLGQALAFLEAQKYAPSLRGALADWLHTRWPAASDTPGAKRLVVRLLEGDTEFLRFATSECLAYLQWLVRFADAEIETKKK